MPERVVYFRQVMTDANDNPFGNSGGFQPKRIFSCTIKSEVSTKQSLLVSRMADDGFKIISVLPWVRHRLNVFCKMPSCWYRSTTLHQLFAAE